MYHFYMYKLLFSKRRKRRRSKSNVNGSYRHSGVCTFIMNIYSNLCLFNERGYCIAICFWITASRQKKKSLHKDNNNNINSDSSSRKKIDHKYLSTYMFCVNKCFFFLFEISTDKWPFARCGFVCGGGYTRNILVQSN